MELADVDRLAKILALELSLEDQEVLFSKFSDTLEKITTLKELNIIEVSPTCSVNKLTNVFQANDQPKVSLTQEDVLLNAPLKSKGLVVVDGDYRYV